MYAYMMSHTVFKEHDIGNRLKSSMLLEIGFIVRCKYSVYTNKSHTYNSKPFSSQFLASR